MVPNWANFNELPNFWLLKSQNSAFQVLLGQEEAERARYVTRRANWKERKDLLANLDGKESFRSLARREFFLGADRAEAEI